MQKEVTQSINLNDPLLLGNLLGPNDENLRFIQDSFQARITVRGSQIEIEGSPIEVDSITTLSSVSYTHRVVKLDAKKKDKRGSRFVQIARSAALQSGRTTIPEIGSIRTLVQLAEQFGPHDLVIVFWEEEDLENLSLIHISIVNAHRDID